MVLTTNQAVNLLGWSGNMGHSNKYNYLRTQYFNYKNKLNSYGYDLLTDTKDFINNTNVVRINSNVTDKQLMTELLTLIDLTNKKQNVVSNVYIRNYNNETSVLPKVWLETGEILNIETIASKKTYPKEFEVLNINIPKKVDELLEESIEFIAIEL